MKLILNGQDITPMTGEVTEFKGELFLSLNFLQQLSKRDEVAINKSGDECRIDIDPTTVMKLLSPKNSFPATLDFITSVTDSKKVTAPKPTY